MKKAEARAQGLKKFSGTPCHKHGATLRYATNGNCVLCDKVAKQKVFSTKQCPECGDEYLVLFTTLNKKWCSGCRHWLEWSLEPGQKPLF